MNNKNVRTSEVFINNQWKKINPIDIKKGMTFRMFEPDGTPVMWEWLSFWEASGDAYYNEDEIVCIPYDEMKVI